MSDVNAKRGQDVTLDSTERVLVRVQGRQWRIEANASAGVAVWDGEHSASLNYYGGRPLEGSVWIGKTKRTIVIQP